jgi:hypothetical protein
MPRQVVAHGEPGVSRADDQDGHGAGRALQRAIREV